MCASAVPVLCAVLLCGCGNAVPTKGTVPTVVTSPPTDTPLETRAVPKKETSVYTFGKVTSEDFFFAAANMDYRGEWIYGAVTEETYALFFGRLRTVFGEPNDTSDDWENMYNYYIACENGSETIYFSVYHGAGGPSILAPSLPDKAAQASYDAAKRALIGYIEEAGPADYTWKGTYYDVPVNITYEVKNGRAKVTSEFPDDPSEFDFEEIL